jgi:hypothetical protein
MMNTEVITVRTDDGPASIWNTFEIVDVSKMK